jgi:hypothetical protein
MKSKRILLLIIFSIFALSLVACTGETGPVGEQGEPGIQGPVGPAGEDGEDGLQTEFRVSADYIQWRYVGEAAWKNLVPLAELVGPAGADIELQVAGGYLQMRYEGSTAWTNLLALSALQGEQGVGILTAELNELGELVLTMTNGAVVNVGEIVGADGENGQEVEMQVNPETGYLQWRIGDSAWANLVQVQEAQKLSLTFDEQYEILAYVTGSSTKFLTTEGIWELDPEVVLYDGEGKYLNNTAQLITAEQQLLVTELITDIVIEDGKIVSLRLVNDANALLTGSANLEVVYGATVDSLVAKLKFPAGSTYKIQGYANTKWNDLAGTTTFTAAYSSYKLIVTSEAGVAAAEQAISILGNESFTTLTANALFSVATGGALTVSPSLNAASLASVLKSETSAGLPTGVKYVAEVEIFNSEFQPKSTATLAEGDKVVVTAVDGTEVVYFIDYIADSVSLKVGSTTVAISNNAGSYAVPFGTNVQDFLASLSSADGRAQTYTLKYNNVVYNPATNPATFLGTTVTPAQSAWSLEVKSANGLVANISLTVAASKDATVSVKTGSEYLVQLGSGTMTIHSELTLDRLTSALQKVDGTPLGTLTVARPGGSTVQSNGQLFTGDVVNVPAESGVAGDAKQFLVFVNQPSGDTSLSLQVPYAAEGGTGKQNYVTSVAGTINVPFSTDFAGNTKVSLALIRSALTGSSTPTVETLRYQAISFEQSIDSGANWTSVATGSESSAQPNNASNPVVIYRAVVTAQNNAKSYYSIVLNGKVTDTSINVLPYNAAATTGTQNVIVQSFAGNPGTMLVAPEITAPGDVVTIQEVLASITKGNFFQTVVLEYKLKTVAEWPTNPTTITSGSFNFTTTDYRIKVQAQEATSFAYYTVNLASASSLTTYGLQANQTIVTSQAGASQIYVSSVGATVNTNTVQAAFTLGQLKAVLTSLNYVEFSFELVADGTAANESLPIRVTDGAPLYQLVVKAQNDAELLVPIYIDGFKTSTTLTEAADQEVFTVNGSEVVVSSGTTAAQLLAAIDQVSNTQTVTIHTNTTALITGSTQVFTYYLVQVKAQDASVAPAFYTIKVLSSDAQVSDVAAFDADGTASGADIEVALDANDVDKTLTITVTGTKKATFEVLASLVSSKLAEAGQTLAFTTSEGTAKTSTQLFTGDRLVVTAEDGTVNTYYIIVTR